MKKSRGLIICLQLLIIQGTAHAFYPAIHNEMKNSEFARAPLRGYISRVEDKKSYAANHVEQDQIYALADPLQTYFIAHKINSIPDDIGRNVASFRNPMFDDYAVLEDEMDIETKRDDPCSRILLPLIKDLCELRRRSGRSKNESGMTH